MATSPITVCDDCLADDGEQVPADGAITLTVRGNGDKSVFKDLCQEHIDGYLENAQPVRRGRPVGSKSKTAARRKRAS